LGFKKRNITAATWLLLAPIVLGGAAAVPFKDDLLWMFGKLLFLLGVDKDPEKWWWDMVRTEWGKTMETAGRMGLSGLAGFDISGSLSIGAQMPSNVLELLGPIGGVVTDVWDATRYGWQGQPLRAMEMLAPRALSDVVRAYREETQGITTREYRPMFDETGRPVHPTTFDTITRGLGFRSAEVGRVSMHTSEVKREQAKLTDRRDEIYMRYRAWYSKPVKDVGEYSQITKMIHSYNTVASTMPGTPLIRMSSLKEQAKAMNVPSKSKRMQMR
jgi:hypothetical protein